MDEHQKRSYKMIKAVIRYWC